MKTLAYLDCPTGISGDMCLGALIHAGVPLGYLTSQLAQLGIQNEFQLRAESVLRNQQAATKAHVDLQNHESHTHESHTHESHTHESHSHESHSHDHTHDHTHESHSHESHSHDHTHDHTYESHSHSHGSHSHTHDSHSPHGGRRLPDIEALIRQASLPERAATWSLAVFRLLAKAEATVHGIPPEQVHFHEVGATDAIVDIVGTCLGLDWLKVDELICSPLPTGGGTVRCEHGLLPVPAPAVLSMMTNAQIPVYSNGIEKELVTPTGCAIAATLAKSFGPPPKFTLQKVGLGAGGRDLALPNILRLWIGTADEVPDVETIVELQTQLDDVSPQAIAYTFDLLFEQGAVDVFTQPISMKKSRLGTLLTVLCPESAVADCEALLFSETTTLGIRQKRQTRSVLAREMITVATAYGDISVKVARAQRNGQVLNVQPEYEDCAKVARAQGIPWHQVHRAAMDMASAALSHPASK